jgi:hypothetical protein
MPHENDAISSTFSRSTAFQASIEFLRKFRQNRIPACLTFHLHDDQAKQSKDKASHVQGLLESSDPHTPPSLGLSIRAIEHIVFMAVVTPLQSP